MVPITPAHDGRRYADRRQSVRRQRAGPRTIRMAVISHDRPPRRITLAFCVRCPITRPVNSYDGKCNVKNAVYLSVLPFSFASADCSSSGFTGAGGNPPFGCGSATYSKSGSWFHGPRTPPCDRLNTNFTVSSGATFPNIGSDNLSACHRGPSVNICMRDLARARRCVAPSWSPRLRTP